MKLKLPLWATLFTLISLCILLSLGAWQLQRLQWKEQLNAQRSIQLETTIDLDAIPMDSTLPELDYRRVTLTGRFMNLGRLTLSSRVYDGQVGWHVVEFFEQDTGRIWLINRGWVAQEELAALPPTSEDTQSITAIGRRPHPPGMFTPENNPARNLWYTYTPAAMMEAVTITSPAVRDGFLARARLTLPYVLEVEYSNTTPPLGGVTPLVLPNNHLQYALTWFALAVVLLGVYGVFVHKLNKV